MRKLQPTKIKGVKNSLKQTTKHYKCRFLNTKNIFLALLLLEFEDDLKNFR